MTAELLPCPFCGSPAVLDTDLEEAWCSCRKCYASTDGSRVSSHAVENWNRRAIFRNCDRFKGETAADDAMAEFFALGDYAVEHGLPWPYQTPVDWLLAPVEATR